MEKGLYSFFREKKEKRGGRREREGREGREGRRGGTNKGEMGGREGKRGREGGREEREVCLRWVMRRAENQSGLSHNLDFNPPPPPPRTRSLCKMHFRKFCTFRFLKIEDITSKGSCDF